jgi:ABC-type Fe3+ transport system substrate-binding protein
LPDTWEELIDPKWSGAVVIDPRGRPFDLLALDWGVDQAVDYAERLKAGTNPLVIEGATAGMLAVASGEAKITTNGRTTELGEQLEAGAPLGVKFLDSIPLTINYNVMLNQAQHPLAAQCFVAWFATGEGQKLHEKLEYKTNELIPPDAPPGAKTVAIVTAEDGATVTEAAEKIGKVFIGS